MSHGDVCVCVCVCVLVCVCVCACVCVCVCVCVVCVCVCVLVLRPHVYDNKIETSQVIPVDESHSPWSLRGSQIQMSDE